MKRLNGKSGLEYLIEQLNTGMVYRSRHEASVMTLVCFYMVSDDYETISHNYFWTLEANGLAISIYMISFSDEDGNEAIFEYVYGDDARRLATALEDCFSVELDDEWFPQ